MKKLDPHVYLFTLGHFSVDWVQGAIPALLPYFITTCHLNYQDAATLIFGNLLLSSVSQPLFGYYSDKISKPWFVPLGSILSGVCLTALSFTQNYWLIFLFSMFCGFGASMFHPEAARMVNRISGSLKGQAMGSFSVGGNAGFAVGPLVAGFCAYAFDIHGLVIFGIINMIMRLAPIGAFGAMAFTIGKYGVGTLVQLGQLIICFYITCILFVVLVLGSIAKATGFSIFKFIRYIREELLIVLGTSSSESALPRMLDKMEKLGCRKSVVGLVIPTGYSFNLDGTSIYLTMAAVFIAQATNSQMDIVHQITLLIVLLLSSKGAAGVTGSGFIVLAATLSAVGHLPVAGLALILGIDRFMSEARALTNLVGNGVATIVVAKWVKELDHKKLDDVLNNRAPDGKTHELSS